jgi:hypothetical protein
MMCDYRVHVYVENSSLSILFYDNRMRNKNRYYADIQFSICMHDFTIKKP